MRVPVLPGLLLLACPLNAQVHVDDDAKEGIDLTPAETKQLSYSVVGKIINHKS